MYKYRVFHLKNYKNERLWYRNGTLSIQCWKSQIAFEKRQISSISKNLFTFLSCLFTIFQIKYCLSNAFWPSLCTVICIAFRECSIVNLLYSNHEKQCEWLYVRYTPFPTYGLLHFCHYIIFQFTLAESSSNFIPPTPSSFSRLM